MKLVKQVYKLINFVSELTQFEPVSSVEEAMLSAVVSLIIVAVCYWIISSVLTSLSPFAQKRWVYAD